MCCLKVAADSRRALAGLHICLVVNPPHSMYAEFSLLTLWVWFYPKGEIDVRPPFVG